MRQKLTIDRGNSAVKAAAWHDNHIIATDIFHSDYAEEIAAFARRHGIGGRFDSAIYSSVGDRAGDIVETIESLSGRMIELSSHTPMPLTLDYRSPSTLGCDRMVARRRLRHGCHIRPRVARRPFCRRQHRPRNLHAP